MNDLIFVVVLIESVQYIFILVILFFYCAEISIDYNAQILLLKLLQKFSKED